MQLTNEATLGDRIWVAIVGALLGVAVGAACWVLMDGIPGIEESNAKGASAFLGGAIGVAFYVLGSHVVKILSFLVDQAVVRRTSSKES